MTGPRGPLGRTRGAGRLTARRLQTRGATPAASCTYHHPITSTPNMPRSKPPHPYTLLFYPLHLPLLHVELFHDVPQHVAAGRRVRHYAAHEHVTPEPVVGDDLAAAQVLYPEAEEPPAVVGLEHGGGGVRRVVRGARARVDEVRPVTLLLELAADLLSGDDQMLGEALALLLHLVRPGGHVVLRPDGEGDHRQVALLQLLPRKQRKHLLPEEEGRLVGHGLQHVGGGEGGEGGEDGRLGAHLCLRPGCVLYIVVRVIQGVHLVLVWGGGGEHVGPGLAGEAGGPRRGSGQAIEDSGLYTNTSVDDPTGVSFF